MTPQNIRLIFAKSRSQGSDWAKGLEGSISRRFAKVLRAAIQRNRTEKTGGPTSIVKMCQLMEFSGTTDFYRKSGECSESRGVEYADIYLGALACEVNPDDFLPSVSDVLASVIAVVTNTPIDGDESLLVAQYLCKAEPKQHTLTEYVYKASDEFVLSLKLPSRGPCSSVDGARRVLARLTAVLAREGVLT